MPASTHDIEYFRRIGDSKRRAHEAALQEHLALTLDERLDRSWSLAIVAAEWDSPRDDDPSPFYERARALGLYIP